MTVTFTTTEVRSPHAWPSQVKWGSGNYDFNQSEISGYKLLQAIIADSTGDLYPDAPGLWRSGNRFHDMLCKYSRSDTAAITCPADWVDFVLKDMGAATADIDTVSFGAAKTLFAAAAITFNGAFFRKDSRERWLSNLLVQIDSRLKLSDKIELHQFSATSVETFTRALDLTFRPARIVKSSNDSGRVHWPDSMNKPMDLLSGKAIVPTHSGETATTDNPSSSILKAYFLVGQSQNAQRAAQLHFQKRFEQKNRVSFQVAYTDIVARDTLSPGQVVTVNSAKYGGSRDIVIIEMRFGREFDVEITGIELKHLEDWGDISPAAITVTEDPAQEAYPAVPGEEPDPGDIYIDKSFTQIDSWQFDILVMRNKNVTKAGKWSFEAATGGMCTVIVDDKGNDNYMRIIGAFDHPAFTIGSYTTTFICVGMFLSSIGTWNLPISHPNILPVTSLNYTQAREACALKGEGWHMLTNWEWAAIVLQLMGTSGVQPRGNTANGLSHANAYEAGKRECTGVQTYGGTGPISWRNDGSPSGIADMVGNVWEWVDGLKLGTAPNNGKPNMPTTNDFINNIYTGFDFTLIESSPWSGLDGTGADQLLKDALVVPEAEGPYPEGDLILTDTEGYAVRGGAYDSGAAAGLAGLKFVSPTSTGYGFRVAYIGQLCFAEPLPE